MLHPTLALRRSSKQILLHTSSRKRLSFLGASSTTSTLQYAQLPTLWSSSQHNNEARRIHIEPHPLPAVAYDYVDDDFCEDEVDDELLYDANDKNNLHHNYLHINANSGGGPTSMSGVENDKLSNLTRFVGHGGGGGGGGGSSGGGSRHRCPKCGANVTFQDASLLSGTTTTTSIQSNCFYCASCSGWFLIQPPTANNNNLVHPDHQHQSAHSKYLLTKLGEQRSSSSSSSEEEGDNSKISQPQFVMHHVSQ